MTDDCYAPFRDERHGIEADGRIWPTNEGGALEPVPVAEASKHGLIRDVTRPGHWVAANTVTVHALIRPGDLALFDAGALFEATRSVFSAQQVDAGNVEVIVSHSSLPS